MKKKIIKWISFGIIGIAALTTAIVVPIVCVKKDDGVKNSTPEIVEPPKPEPPKEKPAVSKEQVENQINKTLTYMSLTNFLKSKIVRFYHNNIEGVILEVEILDKNNWKRDYFEMGIEPWNSYIRFKNFYGDDRYYVETFYGRFHYLTFKDVGGDYYINSWNIPIDSWGIH